MDKRVKRLESKSKKYILELMDKLLEENTKLMDMICKQKDTIRSYEVRMVQLENVINGKNTIPFIDMSIPEQINKLEKKLENDEKVYEEFMRIMKKEFDF